ncbi:MAG: hypothetical protein LBR79_05040 [Oscillospiraceae bacterium]|jgi:hypothetical protein|nr:hypothetical protein [Oscillospiraceae bacterium]
MKLPKIVIMAAAAIALAIATTIAIIKLKNTSTLPPPPSGVAADVENPDMTSVTNGNTENSAIASVTNVANPDIAHVATGKSFNNAEDCLEACPRLFEEEKIVLERIAKSSISYQICKYKPLKPDELGIWYYLDGWEVYHFNKELNCNCRFWAHNYDKTSDVMNQVAILYKDYPCSQKGDCLNTEGVFKLVDWCDANDKPMYVFSDYLN